MLTLVGTYVRPRSRPVWAGGLVAALGEFEFSPGAARVALTRLVARDAFVRTKSGRHAQYAITPRTEAILTEGDARIFTLGRTSDGDDDWTVVWHTVPEDRKVERGRLTRRLRFLGFGPMQDGTWIAPRNHEADVNALLDDMDLREHATVWIGRPAGERDLHGIVTRIWDLDELALRYRAFTDEFSPHAGRAAHDMDDRTALIIRTRLIHAFRQFPFADPELPEQYVAPPPHRCEAVNLFHDVYNSLAEPAQRHFDKVISP